jgi:hypothetical protein
LPLRCADIIADFRLIIIDGVTMRVERCLLMHAFERQRSAIALLVMRCQRHYARRRYFAAIAAALLRFA